MHHYRLLYVHFSVAGEDRSHDLRIMRPTRCQLRYHRLKQCLVLLLIGQSFGFATPAWMIYTEKQILMLKKKQMNFLFRFLFPHCAIAPSERIVAPPRVMVYIQNDH